MSENHQKLYRPQCIVHTTLQNVLSLLDIVVWMDKGICELIVMVRGGTLVMVMMTDDSLMGEAFTTQPTIAT